jgi:hypothetical protein
MKKLKLRDITAKAPKGALNLLTGKPVKTNRKKKNKKPIIDNTDALLYAKDTSTGLSNDISNLPQEVQQFINNSKIKQIKINASESTYILDNGFTLKYSETKLGNKHKKHIVLRKGKKTFIDTYIT